jgi:lysozyme
MPTFKGIDVSHHQGAIDWFSVKGAGVQFAFVKATEGTTFVDDKFAYNVASAKKYNISVGPYHFGRFDTVAGALSEVKFFLDNIKDFDFTYPVVLDLEVNKNGVSKKQFTDSAIAFLEEVEKAGYFAMWYSGKDFARQNLDLDRMKPYASWIAYPEAKSLGMTADIWQYSWVGKVNGIKGNVDMDLSYRDFALEIQLMEERRKPKEKIVTYTVKKGDNLTNIATAYNTTINKILKLNPSITNKDMILPKQKIKVPDNR